MGIFSRFRSRWSRAVGLAIFVLIVVAVLLPAVRAAREAARWSVCVNNLRELVLRKTKVDDAALIHLLNFPNLHRLDLSETAVRRPGLVHLRGLAALEELSLDDTPLADKDLQQLNGLDNLNVLSLQGTRVTVPGAHRLRLKNLRTVLLRGQKVAGPAAPSNTSKETN